MDDPRLIRQDFAAPVEDVTSYLEHSVVRVLAPNPSPMTLDGTNSYVTWNAATGDAIIIDPGPHSLEHHHQLDDAIRERDLNLRGVVLTHHHADHSESAFELGRARDVPVFAHPDAFPGMSYSPLRAFGTSVVGGVRLDVIPTPGHCGDHIAFLTETGALFSGDHILGRGTSVVASPDGVLSQYLESLERIKGLTYDTLLPGHGPSMEANLGAQVVEYYLAHRADRLRQIQSYLQEEDGMDLPSLTRRIYGEGLSPAIQWAGSATTQAALNYLIELGMVDLAGERYQLAGGSDSK